MITVNQPWHDVSKDRRNIIQFNIQRTSVTSVTVLCGIIYYPVHGASTFISVDGTLVCDYSKNVTVQYFHVILFPCGA